MVVYFLDTFRDKVCEFYNCREPCGLQGGMAVFSGKIDDAGNGCVANLRKLLLDTDAGQKRTVSECDISDMLPYAEGSINSDDERTVKG
jgi:hypothetical protein